jgi:MoxR-like ATPase
MAGQSTMRDIAPSMQLTREDIRQCKAQALSRVRVPASVIQLITDLRTYLQEKVEPPVYISDRRLVKAIQLLQVGEIV